MKQLDALLVNSQKGDVCRINLFPTIHALSTNLNTGAFKVKECCVGLRSFLIYYDPRGDAKNPPRVTATNHEYSPVFYGDLIVAGIDDTTPRSLTEEEYDYLYSKVKLLFIKPKYGCEYGTYCLTDVFDSCVLTTPVPDNISYEYEKDLKNPKILHKIELEWYAYKVKHKRVNP